MSRKNRRIGRFTGAALCVLVMIAAIAAPPGTAHEGVRTAPVQSLLPGAAHGDSAAAVADTAGADSSASPAPPAGETANPRIRITLETGDAIDIELFPDKAPLAVERILALVDRGFYNGLAFHRVESYLVQTGKRGSDLPALEGEMFGQRLGHDEGMVGMARLPDDYDSATTQFYIMKERRPALNGEYTLFGRVLSGMDVVRNIKKGSTIESVELLP